MTSHSAVSSSPAARLLPAVADVSAQFMAADYVCSKETATAVFLMVQLQRPGVIYRELPKSLADGAPRCETSLVWPEGAGPVVARFVEHVTGTLA